MILSKRPGPIQILAGEGELWVFIEITWMAKSGNDLASPNYIPVGNEKYIIRYDGREWRTPIMVPFQHYPKLNANTSCIFRSQGDFFLITESSHPDRQLMYRWSNSQFELLDVPKAQVIKKKIGYLDDTSVLANEKILDAETIHSHWKVIYRSTDPFPLWGNAVNESVTLHRNSLYFHWEGIDFSIRATLRNTAGVIDIVQDDGIDKVSSELVTFDAAKKHISYSDYQLLRKH
jgi:hypothetical protein